MRSSVLAPAVAAAAALSLVAAGCGGSSAGAGSATSTSTSTSTGTGQAGPARALSAADRAQLEKYRACLQKQGIDFGFFGRDGQPRNGQTPGGPPPAGTTTFRRPDLTPAQQAKRQKALAACRSLAPSGGFGFGRQGAQPGQPGSQVAAYRTCMQQHGIKFAAPGSTQQPSFDAKKFQAATRACGHLLAQSGQSTTTTTATTGAG